MVKVMLHSAASVTFFRLASDLVTPVLDILLLSITQQPFFGKPLLHHSVISLAQFTGFYGLTPPNAPHTHTPYPSTILTEVTQDHQRQAQGAGHRDPSAGGHVTGLRL